MAVTHSWSVYTAKIDRPDFDRLIRNSRVPVRMVNPRRGNSFLIFALERAKVNVFVNGTVQVIGKLGAEEAESILAELFDY